jgi:hypothetical protein
MVADGVCGRDGGFDDQLGRRAGPSSVNDSARAMIAATAKYRDDIAGAIVTSGTSTAYAVSSYQAFDTLAHLSGQMIAFTPHTTNGATVTLSMESYTFKAVITVIAAGLVGAVWLASRSCWINNLVPSLVTIQRTRSASRFDIG